MKTTLNNNQKSKIIKLVQLKNSINELGKDELKKKLYEIVKYSIDLEKQITLLENNFDKLQETLTKFKEPKVKYQDYNIDWSISKKITFILSENPSGLSSNEIITEFINIEGIENLLKWKNPNSIICTNIYRLTNRKIINKDLGYGSFGIKYSLTCH